MPTLLTPHLFGDQSAQAVIVPQKANWLLSVPSTTVPVLMPGSLWLTHMVPAVLADAHGPKLGPPSLLWSLDTLGMHPHLSHSYPNSMCPEHSYPTFCLSPVPISSSSLLPSMFTLWLSVAAYYRNWPPGSYSPIIRIPGTTPFNFPPGRSG